MFKKLRQRRAAKRAKKQAIFREKHSLAGRSNFPTPALTATLSEEESLSSASLITLSHGLDNTNNNILQTEQEIAKLQKQIEILKEDHAESLADKDEVLAQAVCDLQSLQGELDDSLEALRNKQVAFDKLEKDYCDQEIQLARTTMDLTDTKDELVQVSKLLMEHQMELYEKNEELNTMQQLMGFGKSVVEGLLFF